MPDRSKAERVGYVIEVEGGEEGPQSVYIPAKPAREPVSPSATPVPAQASRGVPGPVPQQGDAAGVKQDAKAEKSSFWSRLFSSREETVDEDSALNKASKREEDLSGRRYGSKKSDVLDTKYERRDAVGFEMWERRFDSYGRKRNESVDMSSRFAGERLEKERVSYERKDFNDFERRTDKAEVKNWDERRAREFSERFSDPEKRMSFRDRMATGYSLMSQVSMQDINRYQYRRNRSDEKGALPVAKPGAEAKPMNAGK